MKACSLKSKKTSTRTSQMTRNLRFQRCYHHTHTYAYLMCKNVKYFTHSFRSVFFLFNFIFVSFSFFWFALVFLLSRMFRLNFAFVNTSKKKMDKNKVNTLRKKFKKTEKKKPTTYFEILFHFMFMFIYINSVTFVKIRNDYSETNETIEWMRREEERIHVDWSEYRPIFGMNKQCLFCQRPIESSPKKKLNDECNTERKRRKKK